MPVVQARFNKFKSVGWRLCLQDVDVAMKYCMCVALTPTEMFGSGVKPLNLTSVTSPMCLGHLWWEILADLP